MTSPPIPPARDEALSKRAQEILDTAIALFNRDGVARTSTNKIAGALGMSSGNLHYHFRSKGDILVASYGLIERALVDAMAMDDGKVSPQGALAVQLRVFGTLWRYRFFLGSMEVVLAESAAVFHRYVRFQDWMVGRIEVALHRAETSGLRLPIRLPNTPALVARNSWMLWTGWIRWEAITAKSRIGGDEDDRRVILRVIRRHLSFQEPYYPSEFALDLERLIAAEEQRLPAAE